jgi:hypothetical protein
VHDLGSVLGLKDVGLASDVAYENDLVDAAAHLILRVESRPIDSGGSIELASTAGLSLLEHGRCGAVWGKRMVEGA